MKRIASHQLMSIVGCITQKKVSQECRKEAHEAHMPQYIYTLFVIYRDLKIENNCCNNRLS